MSAWATQRKFYITFSFILGVSFILLVSIFFGSREIPTCTDGVMNQSEIGVDCGGECPSCALPARPLLSVWTNVFPLAPGVYAAAAYVENQNDSLYVPSVQYEMKFYDATGLYIDRASSFTTINPKGVTPIFVPIVRSGERRISSVEFSFVDEPVFQEVPRTVKFTTLDSSITPSLGGAHGTATVRSSSETVAREVEFVLIAYDANGNAVAASSTIVEDVASDTEYSLQYTWVNSLRTERPGCPASGCPAVVERIEIVPIVLQW